MSKDSINQTLKARFAAPLKDFYTRRIIFWQDPEREFEPMLEELDLPDVKILKLTGSNNFIAKKTLLADDPDSNYLVYNPIRYEKITDNWLLDVELMNEEFRADLLSMRMQALNMAPTPELRKAMRAYSRFFDSKERTNKLLAFKSSYAGVSQLHIDVLAVLAGSKANSAPGVIRALLNAGLNPDENNTLANIRKFGSEEILWRLIYSYTGYIYDEKEDLTALAAHILLTALSVTLDAALPANLRKYISAANGQLCYDLVYDWMHSEQDDEIYEIARVVEETLNLADQFDGMEVSSLLDSECFPCINECILRHYMAEISENVIKADDIIATVEKRRTLKWYKRVRYYYDGLLQIAQMQQFYHRNIQGFPIGVHTQLWKEYCGNFCRMDHYYRMFHTAFSKSLKESSTVLEDLYKGVAEYVENLYKNWYLKELSSQWTKLTCDELAQSAKLPGILQQTEFYNHYVRPAALQGRTYVIISDALRYEVAVDLTGQLLRETKGSAKISAVQAAFPSATQFGMAALLPHRSLTLENNGKVLCDGMPTDGTENRRKILDAAHPGDVAVAYKMLLTMTKAEHDALVGNAQVVYIYHNTIDAAGDKAATEDRVFEACEDAIVEIKNLVKRITSIFRGTNILITADHGFLYSYKPLEELDKTEKSCICGDIVDLDRRYVLVSGACTAEHMLKIPMDHLNSQLSGFTPLGNIRIRKAGGGMNYVHGGISLQECVVPVIEFKNLRSNSRAFVDVRKAELQLISQSRKISNSIFTLDFYQKEPVGGKIAGAEYEIYMADASGKVVSDRQTIIADKTSTNGAERLFRGRFTLKSIAFKKTDTYYLTVAEKGTANVADRIEYTIDIAFVNDFDF